jgi:FkbH-like protein
MTTQQCLVSKTNPPAGSVKCVVWDLDGTLWVGIALEDRQVRLKENSREIVRVLDERGILQSVASRGDSQVAEQHLKEFGLSEYFLYPQINWNAKSDSVRRIAELLNLGITSLAFVDDQSFERAEVEFALPGVLCLDGTDLTGLLDAPELIPSVITDDSRRRRHMYLAEAHRKREEETFTGPKEEFLASLDMVFAMGPASEQDLMRAEELTVRTHQLNSTGYTYSYAELDQFRTSPKHKLLVAGLSDKFGSYGTIGLALLECTSRSWIIKLLLTSCRVISRGVGSIFLNQIMTRAKRGAVRLCAEFIPTERNRLMWITYRLAGFREIGKRGEISILENNLDHIHPSPSYVRVDTSEWD